MSLLKTMPSQRSELPLMTFARKVKPHNVYYMSYGACCNTLTQDACTAVSCVTRVFTVLLTVAWTGQHSRACAARDSIQIWCEKGVFKS